jgi:outer membrane protein TolC
MIRAGALALALWASGAGADPLDEAIGLVLAESPQIAQAETALSAIDEQHDWSAVVNVGYQAREFLSGGSGTLEGGQAGPNAGITVRIPLFDTKRQVEAMKARAAISVTRDQVLREFVQAAAELRTLADQQAATTETAELLRDKLKYYDEQEKAAQIDAAALWPQAEAAKSAEQAARKAALAFALALETTARKYGGDQWKKLKALLAGYAKSRT